MTDATDSAQIKKAEPKKFAFVGYEVGGWGALLAFVISVVTLLLTAVDRWVLGPAPVIYPPEIINLVCDKWYTDDSKKEICPPDGNVIVVANPITFLNDTAAPHSYVVSSVSVLVTLSGAAKGNSIFLKWFYFNDDEAIGPITVAPQTNVAKEIRFYPRRSVGADGAINRGDFMRFTDFQSAIAQNGVTTIELEFSAVVRGREPITTKCWIPVDEDFVANATDGELVLFSRECIPL